MRRKVWFEDSEKMYVFLLPLISIVTQWISIVGIRMSWMVAGILALVVARGYRQIFKNYSIILLVFCVLLIPIFTFSIGTATTFNFSLYLSLFTGMIYLLYIFSMSENEYDVFIQGCFWACAVFLLLGVIEIFSGKYLFSIEPDFTERLNENGVHYPIVAFANVNDLAQYLAMLFPISAVRVWKKNKRFVILTLLPLFFVVYHTQSRLSLLALIMVLPLAYLIKAVVTSKNRILDGKNKLIIYGIVGLGMLLIMALITGGIQKVVRTLIAVCSEVDFIQLRMEIYLPLIKHALSAPIGGFGTSYSIIDMTPHNLFLFILCDYGWIPTVLFIILLFKVFVRIIIRANIEKKSMFNYLLLAELLLFPMLSMVSSCNEQRKVVWIFMGICIQRAFSYSFEESIYSDEYNKVDIARGKKV